MITIPDLLQLGLDEPGTAEWLEALGRWVLAFEGRPGDPDCPRVAALRAFEVALVSHPERAKLEARIRTFWRHGRAVRLLVEMGVADQPTFLREALHRLTDRFLPRVDAQDDLYAFVDRLEPRTEDGAWLRSLPADLREAWTARLALEAVRWPEAIRLLAFRVAALGLSRDLRRLFPEIRDLESAYALLPDAVGDPREGLATVLRCLGELEEARRRLEAQGVSTDLVYRLDLLETKLHRLRTLLNLELGLEDGVAFAGTLLEGAAAQRRIRPLFHSTLRRLARKIVEHSGETGEHYLARTRAAFWVMGAEASGGGALTAFTALFKVMLAALPLAPGPVGLIHTANYAGSFMVMHFLHFSLASKQPAATAAALAGALDGPRDHETEVDMVAAITRGQVAATLGNLLAAMPVAFLVDRLWQWVLGHPVMDAPKAVHTVASFHPFLSWTLPFAAFTGVILWAGSLAGGWSHNWSAHRNLPVSVARSRRIRTLLGRDRAERLGRGLQKHLPGLVSCLALGLMLGFLPLLLAFIGLPLEVRHVTLSAASLALAFSQNLGSGAIPLSAFAWGLAGVACIGLLNFGVSFLLSLRLALRARDLGELDRQALRGALWEAFRQDPRRFLWPRKGDA